MNRWLKLAAAPRSDRSLLFEALLQLLRARFELLLLPFASVMPRPSARAQRENHENSGPGEARIRRIEWAVETAARHAPLPLTCLPQALTAWRMLQARGCSPRLIYGVSHDREAGFSAHAWVELDGVPVVGGGVAHRFTVLAEFPQGPCGSDYYGADCDN